MPTFETPVVSLPSTPTSGPEEVFMATAGRKHWQRANDLFLVATSSTWYAEQISTAS